MQTLGVNGYDMAYLDVGTGPPLVCVHGTLGDSAPGIRCSGH